MYTDVYIYIYMCIHIYIYIERERDVFARTALTTPLRAAS